jgi:hypothetical protein
MVATATKHICQVKEHFADCWGPMGDIIYNAADLPTGSIYQCAISKRYIALDRNAEVIGVYANKRDALRVIPKDVTPPGTRWPHGRLPELKIHKDAS